jgi:hypothetical protein
MSTVSNYSVGTGLGSLPGSSTDWAAVTNATDNAGLYGGGGSGVTYGTTQLDGWSGGTTALSAGQGPGGSNNTLATGSYGNGSAYEGFFSKKLLAGAVGNSLSPPSVSVSRGGSAGVGASPVSAGAPQLVGFSNIDPKTLLSSSSSSSAASNFGASTTLSLSDSTAATRSAAMFSFTPISVGALAVGGSSSGVATDGSSALSGSSGANGSSGTSVLSSDINALLGGTFKQNTTASGASLTSGSTSFTSSGNTAGLFSTPSVLSTLSSPITTANAGGNWTVGGGTLVAGLFEDSLRAGYHYLGGKKNPLLAPLVPYVKPAARQVDQFFQKTSPGRLYQSNPPKPAYPRTPLPTVSGGAGAAGRSGGVQAQPQNTNNYGAQFAPLLQQNGIPPSLATPYAPKAYDVVLNGKTHQITKDQYGNVDSIDGKGLSKPVSMNDLGQAISANNPVQRYTQPSPLTAKDTNGNSLSGTYWFNKQTGHYMYTRGDTGHIYDVGNKTPDQVVKDLRFTAPSSPNPFLLTSPLTTGTRPTYEQYKSSTLGGSAPNPDVVSVAKLTAGGNTMEVVKLKDGKIFLQGPRGGIYAPPGSTNKELADLIAHQTDPNFTFKPTPTAIDNWFSTNIPANPFKNEVVATDTSGNKVHFEPTLGSGISSASQQFPSTVSVNPVTGEVTDLGGNVVGKVDTHLDAFLPAPKSVPEQIWQGTGMLYNAAATGANNLLTQANTFGKQLAKFDYLYNGQPISQGESYPIKLAGEGIVRFTGLAKGLGNLANEQLPSAAGSVGRFLTGETEVDGNSTAGALSGVGTTAYDVASGFGGLVFSVISPGKGARYYDDQFAPALKGSFNQDYTNVVTQLGGNTYSGAYADGFTVANTAGNALLAYSGLKPKPKAGGTTLDPIPTRQPVILKNDGSPAIDVKATVVPDPVPGKAAPQSTATTPTRTSGAQAPRYDYTPQAPHPDVGGIKFDWALTKPEPVPPVVPGMNNALPATTAPRFNPTAQWMPPPTQGSVQGATPNAVSSGTKFVTPHPDAPTDYSNPANFDTASLPPLQPWQKLLPQAAEPLAGGGASGIKPSAPKMPSSPGPSIEYVPFSGGGMFGTGVRTFDVATQSDGPIRSTSLSGGAIQGGNATSDVVSNPLSIGFTEPPPGLLTQLGLSNTTNAPDPLSAGNAGGSSAGGAFSSSGSPFASSGFNANAGSYHYWSSASLLGLSGSQRNDNPFTAQPKGSTSNGTTIKPLLVPSVPTIGGKSIASDDGAGLYPDPKTGLFNPFALPAAPPRDGGIGGVGLPTNAAKPATQSSLTVPTTGFVLPKARTSSVADLLGSYANPQPSNKPTPDAAQDAVKFGVYYDPMLQQALTNVNTNFAPADYNRIRAQGPVAMAQPQELPNQEFAQKNDFVGQYFRLSGALSELSPSIRLGVLSSGAFHTPELLNAADEVHPMFLSDAPLGDIVGNTARGKTLVLYTGSSAAELAGLGNRSNIVLLRVSGRNDTAALNDLLGRSDIGTFDRVVAVGGGGVKDLTVTLLAIGKGDPTAASARFLGSSDPDALAQIRGRPAAQLKPSIDYISVPTALSTTAPATRYAVVKPDIVVAADRPAYTVVPMNKLLATSPAQLRSFTASGLEDYFAGLSYSLGKGFAEGQTDGLAAIEQHAPRANEVFNWFNAHYSEFDQQALSVAALAAGEYATNKLPPVGWEHTLFDASERVKPKSDPSGAKVAWPQHGEWVGIGTALQAYMFGKETGDYRAYDGIRNLYGKLGLPFNQSGLADLGVSKQQLKRAIEESMTIQNARPNIANTYLRNSDGSVNPARVNQLINEVFPDSTTQNVSPNPIIPGPPSIVNRFTTSSEITGRPTPSDSWFNFVNSRDASSEVPSNSSSSAIVLSGGRTQPSPVDQSLPQRTLTTVARDGTAREKTQYLIPLARPVVSFSTAELEPGQVYHTDTMREHEQQQAQDYAQKSGTAVVGNDIPQQKGTFFVNDREASTTVPMVDAWSVQNFGGQSYALPLSFKSILSKNIANQLGSVIKAAKNYYGLSDSWRPTNGDTQTTDPNRLHPPPIRVVIDLKDEGEVPAVALADWRLSSGKYAQGAQWRDYQDPMMARYPDGQPVLADIWVNNGTNSLLHVYRDGNGSVTSNTTLGKDGVPVALPTNYQRVGDAPIGGTLNVSPKPVPVQTQPPGAASQVSTQILDDGNTMSIYPPGTLTPNELRVATATVIANNPRDWGGTSTRGTYPFRADPVPLRDQLNTSYVITLKEPGRSVPDAVLSLVTDARKPGVGYAGKLVSSKSGSAPKLIGAAAKLADQLGQNKLEFSANDPRLKTMYERRFGATYVGTSLHDGMEMFDFQFDLTEPATRTRFSLPDRNVNGNPPPQSVGAAARPNPPSANDFFPAKPPPDAVIRATPSPLGLDSPLTSQKTAASSKLPLSADANAADLLARATTTGAQPLTIRDAVSFGRSSAVEPSSASTLFVNPVLVNRLQEADPDVGRFITQALENAARDGAQTVSVRVSAQGNKQAITENDPAVERSVTTFDRGADNSDGASRLAQFIRDQKAAGRTPTVAITKDTWGTIFYTGSPVISTPQFEVRPEAHQSGVYFRGDFRLPEVMFKTGMEGKLDNPINQWQINAWRPRVTNVSQDNPTGMIESRRSLNFTNDFDVADYYGMGKVFVVADAPTMVNNRHDPNEASAQETPHPFALGTVSPEHIAGYIDADTNGPFVFSPNPNFTGDKRKVLTEILDRVPDRDGRALVVPEAYGQLPASDLSPNDAEGLKSTSNGSSVDPPPRSVGAAARPNPPTASDFFAPEPLPDAVGRSSPSPLGLDPVLKGKQTSNATASPRLFENQQRVFELYAHGETDAAYALTRPMRPGDSAPVFHVDQFGDVPPGVYRALGRPNGPTATPINTQSTIGRGGSFLNPTNSQAGASTGSMATFPTDTPPPVLSAPSTGAGSGGQIENFADPNAPGTSPKLASNSLIEEFRASFVASDSTQAYYNVFRDGADVKFQSTADLYSFLAKNPSLATVNKHDGTLNNVDLVTEDIDPRFPSEPIVSRQPVEVETRPNLLLKQRQVVHVTDPYPTHPFFVDGKWQAPATKSEVKAFFEKYPPIQMNVKLRGGQVKNALTVGPLVPAGRTYSTVDAALLGFDKFVRAYASSPPRTSSSNEPMLELGANVLQTPQGKFRLTLPVSDRVTLRGGFDPSALDSQTKAGEQIVATTHTHPPEFRLSDIRNLTPNFPSRSDIDYLQSAVKRNPNFSLGLVQPTLGSTLKINLNPPQYELDPLTNQPVDADIQMTALKKSGDGQIKRTTVFDSISASTDPAVKKLAQAIRNDPTVISDDTFFSGYGEIRDFLFDYVQNEQIKNDLASDQTRRSLGDDIARDSGGRLESMTPKGQATSGASALDDFVRSQIRTMLGAESNELDVQNLASSVLAATRAGVPVLEALSELRAGLNQPVQLAPSSVNDEGVMNPYEGSAHSLLPRHSDGEVVVIGNLRDFDAKRQGSNVTSLFVPAPDKGTVRLWLGQGKQYLDSALKNVVGVPEGINGNVKIYWRFFDPITTSYKYLKVDPKKTPQQSPRDQAIFQQQLPKSFVEQALPALVDEVPSNVLPANFFDRTALATSRAALAAAPSLLTSEQRPAAKWLNHFLMGSGKPIIIAPRNVIDTVPVAFRNEISAGGRIATDADPEVDLRPLKADVALAGEIERQIAEGRTSGQVSALSADVVGQANSKYFLAVGSAHFRTAYEGNWALSANGKVSFSGERRWVIQDRYNWTSGEFSGRPFDAVPMAVPQAFVKTLPQAYQAAFAGESGAGLQEISDGLWGRFQMLQGGGKPFWTFGVSEPEGVTAEWDAPRNGIDSKRLTDPIADTVANDKSDANANNVPNDASNQTLAVGRVSSPQRSTRSTGAGESNRVVSPNPLPPRDPFAGTSLAQYLNPIDMGFNGVHYVNPPMTEASYPEDWATPTQPLVSTSATLIAPREHPLANLPPNLSQYFDTDSGFDGMNYVSTDPIDPSAPPQPAQVSADAAVVVGTFTNRDVEIRTAVNTLQQKLGDQAVVSAGLSPRTMALSQGKPLILFGHGFQRAVVPSTLRRDFKVIHKDYAPREDAVSRFQPFRAMATGSSARIALPNFLDASEVGLQLRANRLRSKVTREPLQATQITTPNPRIPLQALSVGRVSARAKALDTIEASGNYDKLTAPSFVISLSCYGAKSAEAMAKTSGIPVATFDDMVRVTSDGRISPKGNRHSAVYLYQPDGTSLTFNVAATRNGIALKDLTDTIADVVANGMGSTRATNVRNETASEAPTAGRDSPLQRPTGSTSGVGSSGVVSPNPLPQRNPFAGTSIERYMTPFDIGFDGIHHVDPPMSEYDFPREGSTAPRQVGRRTDAQTLKAFNNPAHWLPVTDGKFAPNEALLSDYPADNWRALKTKFGEPSARTLFDANVRGGLPLVVSTMDQLSMDKPLTIQDITQLQNVAIASRQTARIDLPTAHDAIHAVTAYGVNEFDERQGDLFAEMLAQAIKPMLEGAPSLSGESIDLSRPLSDQKQAVQAIDGAIRSLFAQQNTSAYYPGTFAGAFLEVDKMIAITNFATSGRSLAEEFESKLGKFGRLTELNRSQREQLKNLIYGSGNPDSLESIEQRYLQTGVDSAHMLERGAWSDRAGKLLRSIWEPNFLSESAFYERALRAVAFHVMAERASPGWLREGPLATYVDTTVPVAVNALNLRTAYPATLREVRAALAPYAPLDSSGDGAEGKAEPPGALVRVIGSDESAASQTASFVQSPLAKANQVNRIRGQIPVTPEQQYQAIEQLLNLNRISKVTPKSVEFLADQVRAQIMLSLEPDAAPTAVAAQKIAEQRFRDLGYDQLTTAELASMRLWLAQDYNEMKLAVTDPFALSKIISSAGAGSGAGARAMAQVTSVFDSALEKLPVERGTFYKGIQLNATEMSKFVPGANIELTQYTAASTDSPVASFSHRNARFVIKNGEAKRLTDANPIEREVMFPRNSRFKVLSVTPTVTPDGRSLTIIEIEHIR